MLLIGLQWVCDGSRWVHKAFEVPIFLCHEHEIHSLGSCQTQPSMQASNASPQCKPQHEAHTRAGLPFKPIFHCDAKPFALDPNVGLDPQRHNFALPIPKCWYLKMLKFALLRTRNIKFALPLTPTPNASQWNLGRVGNVHFIFCVLISFAFGSQRKPSFQWNMGFTCSSFSSLVFILFQKTERQTIILIIFCSYQYICKMLSLGPSYLST